MQKLILVRYGQHTDSHLNDQGKETMTLIADKLRPTVENQKVLIVCAEAVRVKESAQLLSELFNVATPNSYAEFYSAEEDGKLPDVSAAADKINALSKNFDILIVVASREYIEQLPSHILSQKQVEMTNLNRGEVLVIDYEKQSLHKL